MSDEYKALSKEWPIDELNALRARVKELEAQLVAVREWLASDDCDGTESLHWRITLEEIVGT